ncbi:MAG: hypothetical protein ABFE16_09330 [Armatimonadia bacterium]
MCRLLGRVAVATLVLAFLGSAQAQERGVQTGVKKVPAMTVAYKVQTSTFEDAGKVIPVTLRELLTAARDNGLHPLGYVVLRVQMDAPPVPGEAIRWELWLPIADAPQPDDLKPQAVVLVKQVEQTPVAFTYHLGPIEQLQETFMDLVTWAMGRGVDLTGEARLITYGQLEETKLQEMVWECQLGTQGQLPAGL